MKPLVSVHITTYNRAERLRRCLDSVLAQDYENLEIIVVDDASEDRTEEVVASYREKDPRIAYYRHERNRGNARARNTALEHSSGEFVAFLDDDDEWTDPRKISRQVALMRELPESTGIVCSGVELVDAEGNRRAKAVSHPPDLVNHILRRNGIIYSPTVLCRASLMREAGGFDEKMPRGVDSEFYRTCIVGHGREVHFMPEITTAVHEHGERRMSPVESTGQQKKILRATTRILGKYAACWPRHPAPLFKRLYDLLSNSAKLLINTVKKPTGGSRKP